MAGAMGDFEASAGRLTREVVENATAPVKDAGLVLIDAAFRWLSRFTLGVLLKAVAAVAAAFFLVIAVGCGCTAAYLALAALVGPIVAWLIVALLFLLLSAVLAFVAVQARVEPRPVDESEAAPGTTAVATFNDTVTNVPDGPPAEDDPVGKPEVEPGLRGTAQALATVLGAAGLPRQKAGVEAGLVLAERLTPLQLAVIGAAAAFSGARDLNKRRAEQQDT